MASFVEIDGSYGEAGGQVLRTALTLAALTGKPTRISKIRAGRRNPGLAPQHLTGVLAAARICGADVRGAEIGSTDLFFTPGGAAREERSFAFDVTHVAKGGSAGSVTLVLQTILFPLVLSGQPVELTIKGGTHVAWSPPFDYLADVFFPVLSRMGLDAGCTLVAWGFYPVGGGEIEVRIGGLRDPGGAPRDGGAPRRVFEPIRLTERGDIAEVTGRAVVANLPKNIADRMAGRTREILEEKGIEASISSLRVGGKSTGAGIFLTARYTQVLAGFGALGKKGLPAERVALDACREFFSFHKTGAAVDRHLADQLVLAMALADGRSEMSVECVTSHLVTNAHVIRQFIDAAIEIEGDEGEPGSVVVEGAGGEMGSRSGGT